MIDLRFANQEQISDSLKSYYFLNPSSTQPVFFILHKNNYSDLITWETAEKECKLKNSKEIYVQSIESWYPNNLSLDKIEEIIEVEIITKDIKSLSDREIDRRLSNFLNLNCLDEDSASP